ncbi:MAG TPA: hypothetical protein VIO64_18735 [Pseudobacteroides sp.]|uniref:hypothetical protein n=1 Tax=Pseudobacteroides sp. TaxID=1968840 RepID=UPI002F93AD42
MYPSADFIALIISFLSADKSIAFLANPENFTTPNSLPNSITFSTILVAMFLTILYELMLKTLSHIEIGHNDTIEVVFLVEQR